MGRLTVFNFTTLNGFFKGPNEDISWHKHGDEEAKFSEENANRDGIILFGRVTYEMMASFWPTLMAKEQFPKVAEGMNSCEKIVFSRTLKKAEWNNTRIISGDLEKEVKQLKKESAKEMPVLGSGTIVTQLADLGLVDEYQVMIDPVAIGQGTPIFQGIKKQLDLKLTNTRTFNSGIMLLCYTPA